MSDHEDQQSYQSDRDRGEAAPETERRETVDASAASPSTDPVSPYNATNDQRRSFILADGENETRDIRTRPGAFRESRIKDRPTTMEATKSSLKIKIELDLEVEVDLYARAQGDVTIGLLE